ncbi:carbohydrate ABC transporter permease [Microlunatus sp. GCM10028923]|uniref:carbohydrate ABC transporter permease n=1 Tax=Microlunatus sp. GCM10028923 TaxID=3273400 RepID=UPI003608DA13
MITRRLHNGQTLPSWPVRMIKGVVLLVVCALVVLPFLGIVSTSLAPRSQVQAEGGFVLIPEQITFEAYRAVLAGGVVANALRVSLIVTLLGTVLSLISSTLLAYGLSRPNLIGQRVLVLIVLLSLLFTPGLIPLYLVVKQAGLLDSIWALILPSMISSFNVIVLRAFFMNLPADVIDAARIDGAGEWQIFTRIVLPLSRAVTAVVGLFYAVAYWNAFFNALLYLNDPAKWPLQMVLRMYVVNDGQLGQSDLAAAETLPAQPSVQMAILILAMVPILLVYPFLQRHFTKGMLTGAVKG